MIVLLFLYFQYDGSRYFSFDYLKSQQNRFISYYSNHPIPTILFYLSLYILSTAISFPGATVLTLAGGALFGLWVGMALVSIAATVGATLCFLVSRYLLRDVIQSRFRDKLNRINDGIERSGQFYLFTLRLLPIFPFFLINLAMGITPISVGRFFWVSWLGMLPGTFLYVNAGTQLGKLESMEGILSPTILLSLVLLAFLPWLAKRFRVVK